MNTCDEIEAIGYNLLDDRTRNIEHEGSTYYCDNLDITGVDTSPDWTGPG